MKSCKLYNNTIASFLFEYLESFNVPTHFIKKLSDREYSKTYWGQYGLFRLALYTYNQTQDLEQSLKMYGEMMRRYPDHPVTELAHAYYCLNAHKAGKMEDARKFALAFTKKYPESEWIPSLKRILESQE